MNILFTGINGALLNNRACDIRLFFCASIMSKYNRITILNKYPQGDAKDYSKLDNVNFVNVISDTHPSLLKRVKARICEIFSIIKLNKLSKIDIIHIYSEHFIEIFLYSLVAKYIHAKTVYQYVEYRSAFSPKGLFKKLDYYLYDHYAAKLCDGVIPISEFLREKALKQNEGIKSLKILPLCNFELYKSNQYIPDVNKPYILYCGSLAYEEVADMICSSFYNSKLGNTHKLVMILSGSDEKKAGIVKKYPQLIVRSNLPYNSLIGYYKHSDCLLIPLRSQISDIARFPNKIAEYLASHKTILTTRVGDMPLYFKDGVNAIVAENYSETALTEKLDLIASGDYNLDSIGQEGYRTGLNYFDCSAYENSVQHFLENL